MTNHELVQSLMDESVLHQAFIIQAIAKYADACSEQRLPENSLINPDAWQTVAKDIKSRIDRR